MPDARPGGLPSSDEVEALARRWVAAAAEIGVDPDAERLSALLRDPRGPEFALGIVDRVIRPDDARVAARNLERLSRRVPRSLPWYLRAGVLAGGGFGVILPRPIIPLVRAAFRRVTRHIVLDATPKRLDRSIPRLREEGVRLDLTLLGEPVLGERAAERRRAGIAELLARPDVDHVSFALSSVASRPSPWGFDDAVDRLEQRLLPLFELAARGRARKLITLDVEEYRDLGLTVAVFTRLLSRPELQRLEAGIVLPAYLPDSLPALHSLTAWARERVAAGGAGITVRLVKGAHLARERVDATLHGWPLATWGSKAETDAHFARLLDLALHPENAEAVRVGVATHNLFDLALAHLLATERGATERVEAQMLLGMSPALAEAVRADAGGVLLRAPVVPPAEFAGAVGYLVGRVQEHAGAEHFLPVLDDLEDPAAFTREAQRHREALDLVRERIPATHRTQDRSHPDVPRVPQPFANEPPTDPAVPGNREWARGILARAASSDLGAATARAARVDSANEVTSLVRTAAEAGAAWGRRPGSSRADALDRAGEVLAAFRGRLIEVVVGETALTLGDADAEVGVAIDTAFHDATRARELAGIRGAEFEPVSLTVVATPATAPLSAAADGVLAALAAGSAVLLKPAPRAVRSAAVFVEALWEAGIPRDVLVLVDAPEDAVTEALVTAPEVGRVLLTGEIETAALFASWRPDLPLMARANGNNALVVTPSADLDLAVRDLVESAFGRSGQSCASASLAILVGSVATSERFRRQLADAVSSLTVGPATDAATQVGPLVAPADGKVARALTRLADGESWLVKPRALDDADRLWSPGVLDGVAAGSWFHRSEALGPVLGLMTAATLDEAIALQNDVAFGLAAGIHSLDAREVATWIDGVQAGDLAVNRPLTGAVVRRRPFGGWKRSAVGPGAMAGGPNTVLVLGSWTPVPDEPSDELSLDGLDGRVRTVIEAFQPALDFAGFDRVRRAAFDDERVWGEEFGRSHDPMALGVERNVFRYRPADVVIRAAEGADPADVARVLVAGVRSRARLLVSSATPLPAGLLPFVDDGTPLGRSLLGILGVTVERDDAFEARVARGRPSRIRLVGGSVADLRFATGGSVDVAVWGGPVTGAGRVELLPFLREQSVSITAHRHGAPDREFAALVV